jgi:predicted GIY-YIG superfamily endonuclease
MGNSNKKSNKTNKTIKVNTYSLPSPQIKVNEVKVNEMKVNEVKVNEVKEKEVKVNEVKEKEVKVNEVKEKEVKVNEVKVKEVKEKEVKVNEVKVNEVKVNEVIYVIRLENNKYYIGKTNNIERRFIEHCSSNNKWLKMYKPIEVIETYHIESIFSEDLYVKEYMNKYGINNVRGGTYSTFDLSEDIIELLNREIIHATDKCFKCGSIDHYSNECSKIKTLTSLPLLNNMCPNCNIKPISETHFKLCNDCLKIDKFCINCNINYPNKKGQDLCLSCWKIDNKINKIKDKFCIKCNINPPNKKGQDLCLPCWKLDNIKSYKSKK